MVTARVLARVADFAPDALLENLEVIEHVLLEGQAIQVSYVVMACVVMAYIVRAYIPMACLVVTMKL